MGIDGIIMFPIYIFVCFETRYGDVDVNNSLVVNCVKKDKKIDVDCLANVV